MRTTSTVIVALTLLAGGCGGESFVEGRLGLNDLMPDDTGFELAEIRAFPEDPAGFAVERAYRGEEVLSQSVRLGSIDVPALFRLEGYTIGDAGGPWRVLAWLTNREDSEWVGAGELYGTRTFAFDCSNGPVCAIRGVDVDVDLQAPPR